MQKLRQENARIIAEQVEKRVAQELEWRDASRLKPEEEPEPEPAESSAAASAAADSAAAAEGNEEQGEEKKKSFVEEFLSSCGLLEVYGAKFEEMGYDSEIAIKLLDSADLDTMGITALGHRRIILNAVDKLNKKQ